MKHLIKKAVRGIQARTQRNHNGLYEATVAVEGEHRYFTGTATGRTREDAIARAAQLDSRNYRFHGSDELQAEIAEARGNTLSLAVSGEMLMVL